MLCPTCRKTIDEGSARIAGGAFPFCSERCKVRDLGKWFDGAYQIPVERDEATDDDEPLDAWVDPNATKRKR